MYKLNWEENASLFYITITSAFVFCFLFSYQNSIFCSILQDTEVTKEVNPSTWKFPHLNNIKHVLQKLFLTD